MNKIVLFIVIVGCLLCTGCSKQEKKWEEVIQKGTIVAYQEYLKDYPKGRYALNAKDSIANITCDSLLKSKSIQQLSDFIIQYPENKRISEVKSCIANIVCDSVLASKSIKKLNDFIALYPEHERINEVKNCIEMTEWEITRRTNCTDSINIFINKYPNSKFIIEAQSLLSNILYNQTKYDIFISVSDEDYNNGRLLYYYTDENGTYYRMSGEMALIVSIKSKNNQSTIRIKGGMTKENISKLLLSKQIPYLNKSAFIIGNSELIFNNNRLVGMR